MPKGYLLLVLHAHLPYVRHPEYDRFLEERWFFEAVTETYIPLIKFFDRLQAEGIAVQADAVGLADAGEHDGRPAAARSAACATSICRCSLAEQECERTKDWPDVHFLAQMYRRLFEEARQTFVERCGTRLVTAFQELRRRRATRADHLRRHARLSAAAALRAGHGAGTGLHGRAGARTHLRPASRRACGCRSAPSTRAWTRCWPRRASAISSSIRTASTTPTRGRCSASAPRCYCPSGVAAFGRHPMTSKLVWSSNVGYPADFNYREYYRDIGFELDQDYLEPFQYAEGIRTHTGIKYHRITGPTREQAPVQPRLGQRDGRAARPRLRPPLPRPGRRAPAAACRSRRVIVSPYDAELFGHWWFEGPQWIYHVLRELARDGGDLELGTPGEYLAGYPIQQKAMPAPSSWGKNGYNEHWVNPKTEWMWRPLHEAAARMRQAVQGTPRRIAGQPGGPGPAAGRPRADAGAGVRLAVHHHQRHHRGVRPPALPRPPEPLPLPADRLDRRELDSTRLEALEYMDAIFPELDYQLFASE